MKCPALVSSLFLAFSLHAATIPYENDFSTSADAFPNSSSGQWSVDGGSYANSVLMSNNSTVSSYSSLQLDNASGTSFSLSTTFNVPTVAEVGSSSFRIIGIAFLGGNSTLSGSSSFPNYLAQFTFAAGTSSASSKGSLILSNPGDSATGFSATAGSAIATGATGVNAIVLGSTYTLKLDVTFSEGLVSMTFGLYDATGTTQIGTAATASDATPLDGDYFGYINRFKTGVSTGVTQTVNFEDFAVASVPEPRTMWLAGLAGLAFLLSRNLRRLAL